MTTPHEQYRQERIAAAEADETPAVDVTAVTIADVAPVLDGVTEAAPAPEPTD